jgi:hypothetical protein
VGILQLLGRDYNGAIESLNRLVKSSAVRIELKVDALLLQALAAVKLQRDPTPFIDSAEGLNPYLQTTKRFQIINLASRSKSGNENQRAVALADWIRVVSEDSFMFDPNDPWFQKNQALVAALSPSRKLEVFSWLTSGGEAEGAKRPL